MTGYRESWKNNIQTNVTLEQKLILLQKDLSLYTDLVMILITRID